MVCVHLNVEGPNCVLFNILPNFHLLPQSNQQPQKNQDKNKMELKTIKSKNNGCGIAPGNLVWTLNWV